MKKYSCIIIIGLAVAAGCKKADYLLYQDTARIQMADTAAASITFVYEAPSVTRDTVYVRLNTIGGITDKDRKVKLEQVTEYDVTYVRDPVTNKITDSVVKEKPFKAVAGKHYIGFDDPAMQSLLVIRANKAYDSIPIILLRDADLKSNSYRLRLKVVANDVFGIGETKAIQKTLVFSDRLERFASWLTDSYSSTAYGTLGKYSTTKHQFIIDVLKVRIDEAWWQAILAAGATAHYKSVLKDALVAFNTDPANISSGKAPMRETSDPNSPLVTFP
ncbi:DUF4843 domain-containing protein [Paraflavitalea soli]|uniref:DUF4843 domain-containing protein n=1 Tax=Paraflavitalea soli TaxID=2315862 RepID=UPI001FE40D72|nr:DUF4843 domain-containing protein [Paraflavitalea soli]